MVRGVVPYAFDANTDSLRRTGSYCYNVVINLPNVDYKNAGFCVFFSGWGRGELGMEKGKKIAVSVERLGYSGQVKADSIKPEGKAQNAKP